MRYLLLLFFLLAPCFIYSANPALEASFHDPNDIENGWPGLGIGPRQSIALARFRTKMNEKDITSLGSTLPVALGFLSVRDLLNARQVSTLFKSAGHQTAVEEVELHKAPADASELFPVSPVHVRKVLLLSHTVDGHMLSAILPRLRNLQELFLNYVPNVTAIASGLSKLTNLRRLHIINSPIGDDGALAFACVFPNLQHLKDITFVLTQIGTRGVQAIAANLPHCKELVKLNLTGNALGPDGAQAIIDSLQFTPNIGHLFLADSRLLDQGAVLISAALSSLQNLRHLELSRNCLTFPSLVDLLGASSVHPSLRILEIRFNLDNRNSSREERIRIDDMARDLQSRSDLTINL